MGRCQKLIMQSPTRSLAGLFHGRLAKAQRDGVDQRSIAPLAVVHQIGLQSLAVLGKTRDQVGLETSSGSVDEQSWAVYVGSLLS